MLSQTSLRKLAERMSRYCGVREWKFTRRDEDGRANHLTKIIETPDPINLQRLYVVAHECGHVALDQLRRGISNHRREYEAEQFAILLLRHYGIAVPSDMITDGQHYVAWHVGLDVDAGTQVIEAETFRWAGRFLREDVRQQLEQGKISLSPKHRDREYESLITKFFTSTIENW